MKERIAVLGGDLRQIRLAELMEKDGWDVVTWGLEKGNGIVSVPLDQALESDVLILPLPVLRGNALNLPLTDTVISPGELWERIRPDQLVLGGASGTLGETLRRDYGLELIDYYEREEVQIANAVPTAEGAIMRMMEETEYTVQESNCLVIGYGRIGKALAQRLQALGATVTVTARRATDLAWIKACGFRAFLMGDVVERLGEFDVIFNTVPVQVMDSEQIGMIRKDALLVELASLPGGFDSNSVRENSLRFIEERGLPGKVAPLSAARAIRDSITQILQERGGVQ